MRSLRTARLVLVVDKVLLGKGAALISSSRALVKGISIARSAGE